MYQKIKDMQEITQKVSYDNTILVQILKVNMANKQVIF